MASTGDQTASTSSSGMKSGPASPATASSSTKSSSQSTIHLSLASTTVMSSSLGISGNGGERITVGTSVEPVMGAEEEVQITEALKGGEGSTEQGSIAREVSGAISLSSRESTDPGQYMFTPRAVQAISSIEDSVQRIEDAEYQPGESSYREEEPVPLSIVVAQVTTPTTGRRIDVEEEAEAVGESSRLRRSRRMARTPVAPPELSTVPSTRRRTRALAALDATEPLISPKKLKFEQGESSSAHYKKIDFRQHSKIQRCKSCCLKVSKVTTF